MVRLRKHLAWVCSASLWCGGVLSAEEPQLIPFPTSAQQAEAAPRFDVDDISARVGVLQQRMERLEAENSLLRNSLHQVQSGSGSGVTPANAEGFNHYAEGACPPDCQCPACAAEKNGKGDWKTGWNNGIEFVSPDKAFKVHIGGRTQLDSVWYANDPADFAGAGGASPPGQDAVTFRRARLRADGTIYETIDYVAEFDFANSTSRNGTNDEANTINVTAPTDLWFNFKEVPWVGNVKVGNIKEPMGFEHNTSSRFLNFMERSFLQDLFAGPFNNGFSPGVMIFNSWADDHGMWFLGGFKNNYFNVFGYDVGDAEYAATGRVTYTPIFDEHEHQVLHFGLSGSVRDPDQGQQRFRTRSLRNGPANLATIFGDTGTYTASTQWLGGFEVAGVSGPWSMQAEWIGNWSEESTAVGGKTNTSVFLPAATTASLGTVYTYGYYAELHYFLTGESREYEKKAGAFGRVVPNKNFRWKDGCFQPGAWQLAFRYGAADLRDGILNGGQLHEYVAGVNWFLNPNMKIQANYVCTQRDFNKATSAATSINVNDGLIHGFGMRLAHDF